MLVVSVDQMRAIEREADSRGVNYAEMMDRAGRGLADLIQMEFGDEEWRVVTALVGSGNNGGDALVALEVLAKAGWHAQAYLVRPRPEKDALLERARAASVEIAAAWEDVDFKVLAAWLEGASVLMDGVLGTGFQLPLRKEIASVLGFAKQFSEQLHVVAVDCPSGVDCDSGEAADDVIPAEITVCMQAVKQGLVQFPAFKLAGELRVVDLDLPDNLDAEANINLFVANGETVSRFLPERPDTAHKGTFGSLVIAAGSVEYTGAALLAARGAYRVGTGLVRLATLAPLHAALAGQFPEVTWLILPNEEGGIAENAADLLLSNLSRVTALLVGPGLGMRETTRAFIARLLSSIVEAAGGQINKINLPPMVMDADGLRLMAGITNWPELLPVGSILTPHPGEMSALTGLTVEQIQSDRLAVAREYAQKWKSTVILKGALTVVASDDGRACIIPVATSALAKAGSGDVLAGLVAGLVAQGRPAWEAAVAGAWIHAQAGLAAAENLGSPASVLASDVLESIPRVLWALQFE